MNDTDQVATLSKEHRQRLEALVRRFEESWHGERLHECVSALPSGDPLRLPALAEMVKLDLGRQWQAGGRRLLEDYLKVYPELGTAATVSPELVKAEFDARKGAGATADPADFAKRFPRQAAQLRTLSATTQETPGPDIHATVAARSTASGRRGSTDMPEVFGRYRILKQLGKGGMGAVYLAQDTQLERQVALKVPHFSSDDGPEVLERFYREARAAATLHHPNICPIFDVGAIEGTHYLTMAYIEGKPLNDFIRGIGGAGKSPTQLEAHMIAPGEDLCV